MNSKSRFSRVRSRFGWALTSVVFVGAGVDWSRSHQGQSAGTQNQDLVDSEMLVCRLAEADTREEARFEVRAGAPQEMLRRLVEELTLAPSCMNNSGAHYVALSEALWCYQSVIREVQALPVDGGTRGSQGFFIQAAEVGSIPTATLVLNRIQPLYLDLESRQRLVGVLARVARSDVAHAVGGACDAAIRTSEPGEVDGQLAAEMARICAVTVEQWKQGVSMEGYQSMGIHQGERRVWRTARIDAAACLITMSGFEVDVTRWPVLAAMENWEVGASIAEAFVVDDTRRRLGPGGAGAWLNIAAAEQRLEFLGEAIQGAPSGDVFRRQAALVVRALSDEDKFGEAVADSASGLVEELLEGELDPSIRLILQSGKGR